MKLFKDYDKENPQIYKAFVDIAKQAKHRGFKNYSAKGVFELIRWHSSISASQNFKLNNIYSPYYARKMMLEYPEFQGFFRLRKVKSCQTN